MKSVVIAECIGVVMLLGVAIYLETVPECSFFWSMPKKMAPARCLELKR